METLKTIDLNQLIEERKAVVQRLVDEAKEKQIEAERYIGELRLLVAMRDGGYTVHGAPKDAGITSDAGQLAEPVTAAA